MEPRLWQTAGNHNPNARNVPDWPDNVSLQTLINDAWQRDAFWLRLLIPFAWVFGAVSGRRRLRLQREHQGRPFSAPVIVVGNITVGGSGKTPLIIALVDALRQRGYRPGVVSRGYGGKSANYPLCVDAQSDPSDCGDEPLLIASKCGCPVVVDPVRVNAVICLLNNFDCDLVLSDDGLQHYALHRDIEIAVVDGNRCLGNRRLLPAGPLREAAQRLDEVDLIVVNGDVPADLSSSAPIFNYYLEPIVFTHLRTGETVAISEWREERNAHAVAGIGNPVRFAETLERLGFDIDLRPKNDHARLQISDLRFSDNLPVIITAKDAVKITGVVPDNVWVLEVAAALPEALVQQIIEAIQRNRAVAPKAVT